MSDEVASFLEHHGVRGQKWGIRNSSNTIRRKAKKAATFISKHKEVIGTVAAGSAFVATILVDKNLRASHPTKAISAGKSWIDSSGSGHSFLNTSVGNLGKFNPNVGDINKAKTFTRLLNA